jgi:hypothetical protein
MEKTWSVAGVFGVWKLTVALIPEEPNPDETHLFDEDETRVALRQFSSLEPHFMTVVNFVECRSMGELERTGARITQWG